MQSIGKLASLGSWTNGSWTSLEKASHQLNFTCWPCKSAKCKFVGAPLDAFYLAKLQAQTARLSMLTHLALDIAKFLACLAFANQGVVRSLISSKSCILVVIHWSFKCKHHRQGLVQRRSVCQWSNGYCAHRGNRILRWVSSWVQLPKHHWKCWRYCKSRQDTIYTSTYINSVDRWRVAWIASDM